MSASFTESNSSEQARFLQCGKRRLDLSYPQVMGVLNVTPDSFSDGGNLHDQKGLSIDRALFRVEQMLLEGAAIIDVGGESTRPGAAEVTLQQELNRVLPVVEAIESRFDTVISVDTSSPEVMLEAARLGAGIINDVRGLEREGAVSAAAKTELAVCLMHMQGQPRTMQNQPLYNDVVANVRDYLQERVAACTRAGVDQARLIVDPGFGFGKSVEHNLLLVNDLSDIIELGYPVLVGLSRKSLIGELTGREVNERQAGSLAFAVLAAERGASIIRVHDVAETIDVIKICRAVLQAGAARLEE